MNSKERADVLIEGRYVIWQAEDVLCYTMDSVLAANFLSLKNTDRVLELGAGTGAISLIAAIRGARMVVGAELNPYLVALLNRSIEQNGLKEILTAKQLDIKELPQLLALGRFDAVVANPPYRRSYAGNTRADASASSACHELTADLNDFIKAAASVLETRGRLVMVNMAERLTDTLNLCLKYRLEPKRLQFVHSKEGTPARLFLLEAQYNVRPGGLVILEPLIVYGADGEYTTALKKYYEPKPAADFSKKI